MAAVTAPVVVTSVGARLNDGKAGAGRPTMANSPATGLHAAG